MKDIKLSFPYPSTSRHNFSQDIAMSLSMGLVTPVRIIEVNPGDSHRIGTSYSLISNPLVKPLLQGVNMRFCRFWIPRRIYHLDQRANNSDFDPRYVPRRYGVLGGLLFPAQKSIQSPESLDDITNYSNFEASSLFDYLGISAFEKNLYLNNYLSPDEYPGTPLKLSFHQRLDVFNVEPYLAYIDICRNYFADSATGRIAWYGGVTNGSNPLQRVIVSPLKVLDDYIDNVQNSRGRVGPYDYTLGDSSYQGYNVVNVPFKPLSASSVPVSPIVNTPELKLTFSASSYGVHHMGLCVPMLRPDRLSRLFDTRPLVSQNASIPSGEVTIANLSFLAKLQRFLTRKFFGGSRFTDVMYSIYGQKVPHVDSPVLLDVFDSEIGSELVASTNATETQTPGVLGGYFSASGNLTTKGERYKKRYFFNESGYIFDLVYIMPRLFRDSFLSDFYPLVANNLYGQQPSEANFIPDLNGIGWQQPTFLSNAMIVDPVSGAENVSAALPAFACEPAWQQFRTLPDIARGLLNHTNGRPTPFQAVGASDLAGYHSVPVLRPTSDVNNPLFTFSDRMDGRVLAGSSATNRDANLNRFLYIEPSNLNSVFGVDELVYDNIFVVFRYSHQVKSQVTKRFTLTF